MCVPYAAATRSPTSSSVRKLTYVPPVEKRFMSRHTARAPSTCSASSTAFSQDAAMLRTALASRLPAGEWPAASLFSAPSSGNSRIAECGDVIVAAFRMYAPSMSWPIPGRYSDFQ